MHTAAAEVPNVVKSDDGRMCAPYLMNELITGTSPVELVSLHARRSANFAGRRN
jgi:hypothetical protein